MVLLGPGNADAAATKTTLAPRAFSIRKSSRIDAFAQDDVML